MESSLKKKMIYFSVRGSNLGPSLPIELSSRGQKNDCSYENISKNNFFFVFNIKIKLKS